MMRIGFRTISVLLLCAMAILAPYVCFISHSLAHSLDVEHSSQHHEDRVSGKNEPHPVVELHDLDPIVLLKTFRAYFGQTAWLMETSMASILPVKPELRTVFSRSNPPKIIFSAPSFDHHPIKAPPAASSGLLF
jgi:hypothetical protein